MIGNWICRDKNNNLLFSEGTTLQSLYDTIRDLSQESFPDIAIKQIRITNKNKQPIKLKGGGGISIRDIYESFLGETPPNIKRICGLLSKSNNGINFKISVNSKEINSVIFSLQIGNDDSGDNSQEISGEILIELLEVTEKKAIEYAERLLKWLNSQGGIPDRSRELPEDEKEVLKNFWATLISEEQLVDQLFKPLQTLQLDSDEATTPPDKSTEKIFEAIKAEIEKTKSPGEENVIKMINQLSDTAKTWLGQLLLHLVKNPGLRDQLQTELQGYLTPFLLFGQTPAHIVPRAWIEASWNYIHHFRCNFGFSATEAMQYPKITIVGTPDVAVSVSEKEEKFLRDYLNDQPDEHKLERLWVRSAEELKALLDQRVARNISFEGGDVGLHAPQ